VSATGIGSLPGADIREAVEETFGELPDFPYLPELPARGPGADLIGRSAAMMAELPVELYAGRWRVVTRAGVDLRRAQDMLERDLDALTRRAEGYTGQLKIQSAGPWTLAAGVELALGAAFLKDHMGVLDLAASLREGLVAHVAEVRRRVPGASVMLQLDEPSLPAVLAGRVATASGLHTYRAVGASTVRDVLASFVDAIEVPVIAHCCASAAPVTLFREAGMAGVAIDLSQVDELDPLGEAIDGGMRLLAGVPWSDRAPADRIMRLWKDLGFPSEKLREVVVTPACGLAAVTPEQARATIKACQEASRRLASD
jgi:Cobalamin-independent synthase, Catalytic domain